MKFVQLQLSEGKLRTEPAAVRNVTNDLHVGIATRLHENVHLSCTVHHLSGPDMFALTRGAVCVCVLCVMWVCVRCVGMCSVWVWCVSLFVVVCVVVCVLCVSHTLSRSRYASLSLLFDLRQWFHVFCFS